MKISASGLCTDEEFLRRIYLDLTGLPPTPAEVATFVNDDSPLAFEKLAARLLASPHYGEQQARQALVPGVEVRAAAGRHGHRLGRQAGDEREQADQRDGVLQPREVRHPDPPHVRLGQREEGLPGAGVAHEGHARHVRVEQQVDRDALLCAAAVGTEHVAVAADEAQLLVGPDPGERGATR